MDWFQRLGILGFWIVDTLPVRGVRVRMTGRVDVGWVGNEFE